jgi:hypothetical protein
MRCPKCKKGGVRQQVGVIVECSADRHSLDKKGIRNKDVKILGVEWALATWFCR